MYNRLGTGKCVMCVFMLPSVQCVASGSGQSEWRRRRESGCGTGSCVCCSRSPEPRQTAPEPALGSEHSAVARTGSQTPKTYPHLLTECWLKLRMWRTQLSKDAVNAMLLDFKKMKRCKLDYLRLHMNNTNFLSSPVRPTVDEAHFQQS